MIALIGRLTNNDPERWVNLDILERELKREGFSRPAGSPRLVTRLRVLKDVEVDSHGRVRLAPGTPVPDFVPAEAVVGAEGAAAADESAARPAAKRRRRRRSKPANGEASGAAESVATPEPATAEEAPAQAAPPKRRRPRRTKPASGASEPAPEPAAETPTTDAPAARRRPRRRSKSAAEAAAPQD
jgi:hypothetical protein